MMNEENKYQDIIHLTRPLSKKHKPMSVSDRAAQFSPFAALTGHDAAIKETARRTDCERELDEYEKAVLDETLQLIMKKNQRSMVQITYFELDSLKAGGKYLEITGVIKKIDAFERVIVMENNVRIPVNHIVAMEEFE